MDMYWFNFLKCTCIVVCVLTITGWLELLSTSLWYILHVTWGSFLLNQKRWSLYAQILCYHWQPTATWGVMLYIYTWLCALLFVTRPLFKFNYDGLWFLLRYHFASFNHQVIYLFLLCFCFCSIVAKIFIHSNMLRRRSMQSPFLFALHPLHHLKWKVINPIRRIRVF